jgi:hypothetical protein
MPSKHEPLLLAPGHVLDNYSHGSLVVGMSMQLTLLTSLAKPNYRGNPHSGDNHYKDLNQLEFIVRNIQTSTKQSDLIN